MYKNKSYFIPLALYGELYYYCTKPFRKVLNWGLVLFLKCPDALTSLNQSSCCHTSHMEQ